MEGSCVLADEIPVAHTPDGGWHGEMPRPILAACTEPLAHDAPDLRATWTAYAVERDGKPVVDHPLNRHIERIEQCGNRVVITAGHVIHDMRVDGTLANGVNDVLEISLTQKIQVAAVFNNGRLDLHPGGVDPARPPLVTREIVDGELIWNYAAFKVTMRKVEPE
jgi:hypothetical protein